MSCSKRRFRGAHRLYLRIYLAVLAGFALVALLFGLVWRLGLDSDRHGATVEALAQIAAEVLPPADAPREAQQAALERWRQRTRAELSLYAGTGELIASAGRVLPAPTPAQSDSGWLPGGHGAMALKLPDGRWLVARAPQPGSRGPLGVVGILALIALAVALGAYPVIRRLTRRLERLQASVEALGAGDLSARVRVEGHDEVARLAQSFNRSAARIEALIASQKALLANASHELRSPLARIRMAVELMEHAASPDTRRELQRNIVELDQLIDEILLASRLEAGTAGNEEAFESVDFTALVAEECARFDAVLSAVPVSFNGDPRLLRRLVRNLLENAHRYASGSPIEVSITLPEAQTVELAVCDRGPGVPEQERERIFEPFYRMPGAREGDGSVGLGLALVRAIAAKHGGAVRCGARVGGGSCFTVSLSWQRRAAA